MTGTMTGFFLLSLACLTATVLAQQGYQKDSKCHERYRQCENRVYDSCEEQLTECYDNFRRKHMDCQVAYTRCYIDSDYEGRGFEGREACRQEKISCYATEWKAQEECHTQKNECWDEANNKYHYCISLWHVCNFEWYHYRKHDALRDFEASSVGNGCRWIYSFSKRKVQRICDGRTSEEALGPLPQRFLPPKHQQYDEEF